MSAMIPTTSKAGISRCQTEAWRKAKDGEKPRFVRPPDDKPRVRITRVQVEGETESGTSAVAVAEAVRDLEDWTDPLNTVSDLFLRGWTQRKWEDPQQAWKEVVLRYRQGSPGAFEVRKVLLQAFAQEAGLELRLEDRFAITETLVVELGTGLCHEGPAKDHLPGWKAEERAAEGNAGCDPPRFPFVRDADPNTVTIVERVLGLARWELLQLDSDED